MQAKAKRNGWTHCWIVSADVSDETMFAYSSVVRRGLYRAITGHKFVSSDEVLRNACGTRHCVNPAHHIRVGPSKKKATKKSVKPAQQHPILRLCEALGRDLATEFLRQQASLSNGGA